MFGKVKSIPFVNTKDKSLVLYKKEKIFHIFEGVLISNPIIEKYDLEELETLVIEDYKGLTANYSNLYATIAFPEPEIFPIRNDFSAWQYLLLNNFINNEDKLVEFNIERGKRIKNWGYDEQQWRELTKGEKDEYFEKIAIIKLPIVIDDVILGIGDGTGNKYVKGDYESIKLLQKRLLHYEETKYESEILSNVLINLHTCRWTGNMEKFWKLIEKIGEYSYARTNSNGHEEEEEIIRKETLRNLKGI